MEIRSVDSRYELMLEGEVRASFVAPALAGRAPDSVVAAPADAAGWCRVLMVWDVKTETPQDDLAVRFDLGFDPDFWWAPHLAPEDGFVIGQHVFRSPAIVARRGALTFVVVPDLDLVGRRAETPWFLDFDARRDAVWIGLARTSVPVHVLYRKERGMVAPPGATQLGFYISLYNDSEEYPNPWGRVAPFLWDRWGETLYRQGEPVHAPLDNYAQHACDWAFDTWGKSVWQEFDLGGKRVGAPQFIVNVTQSPNHRGEWEQREFLSIWNQAWFSSLRSASGTFRHARRTGDDALADKARMTKELALAAPMKDGLFPAVIRTDNEDVQIDGRKYPRPRAWDTARWTNSNRCPWDHGITDAWYHILDASWTCLLMLRWDEELEPDPRLVDYAKRYGEKLISLQDADGFFPGWLHPDTLRPGPVMNRTPESALSATFLFKLADRTGEPKFRQAALRCVDALLVEVVPDGRWEDFETYWSCAPWGRERYLANRIVRNAMYKQNTLSIFWTAEALLEAHRATGEAKYLGWGRRVLDELSMAQQVWQPPFIHVPALGGFGVMNADGEWNDSRQTLFAELFLDYYKATGETRLFERGVAALKAGFVMMYCPENPAVKAQWEKVYPWFGPGDHGFTMENYGHGGWTTPEGEGMGSFTIFDWGNGAAAEAWHRIHDHYGDVYIDRARGNAFAVDSLTVARTPLGWEIGNPAGGARMITLAYEDGTRERKTLEKTLSIGR